MPSASPPTWSVRADDAKAWLLAAALLGPGTAAFGQPGPLQAPSTSASWSAPGPPGESASDSAAAPAPAPLPALPSPSLPHCDPSCATAAPAEPAALLTVGSFDSAAGGGASVPLVGVRWRADFGTGGAAAGHPRPGFRTELARAFRLEAGARDTLRDSGAPPPDPFAAPRSAATTGRIRYALEAGVLSADTARFATSRDALVSAALRYDRSDDHRVSSTARVTRHAGLASVLSEHRPGYGGELGVLLFGATALSRGHGVQARTLAGHDFSSTGFSTRLRWERSGADRGSGDAAGRRPDSAAAQAILPADRRSIAAGLSATVSERWRLDASLSDRYGVAGERERALALLASWQPTTGTRISVDLRTADLPQPATSLRISVLMPLGARTAAAADGGSGADRRLATKPLDPAAPWPASPRVGIDGSLLRRDDEAAAAAAATAAPDAGGAAVSPAAGRR